MPCPAKDQYTKDLYARYELGDEPSMENIEPIATRLLEQVPTLFDGISLVLGRRVDAKENNILAPILLSGTTGEDRFGACLLLSAVDHQRDI